MTPPPVRQKQGSSNAWLVIVGVIAVVAVVNGVIALVGSNLMFDNVMGEIEQREAEVHARAKARCRDGAAVPLESLTLASPVDWPGHCVKVVAVVERVHEQKFVRTVEFRSTSKGSHLRALCTDRPHAEQPLPEVGRKVELLGVGVGGFVSPLGLDGCEWIAIE